MQQAAKDRLNIAVVGTGIAGLSAAWLLSRHHDITVFERAERIGGHCHTVDVPVQGGSRAVDTGFIVYNPVNYPNLTALFAHLGVETQPAEMSFGVSRGGGAFEYSGNGVSGLFAQAGNLVSPQFWRMLADLRRFYRNAPVDSLRLEQSEETLGTYLEQGRYGRAFRDDHLLPMAAAIWSARPDEMLAYPAASFVRFFDNHGLLRLRGRPEWRTVVGGSRRYVTRLVRPFADRVRTGADIVSITRTADGVTIGDAGGHSLTFDRVVIATHADQALGMLADADAEERCLLGAISYSRNLAVLHTDIDLMPRRRAVWSSWNYLQPNRADVGKVCVSYWMNRLQGIVSDTPLIVTLNPDPAPRPGTILHSQIYEHPRFDQHALKAQRQLWTLQGRRNTWFCGAYFGAGFHEDGLQAGLAVGEDLGGARRPWTVTSHSDRIVRWPVVVPPRLGELAS